MSGMFQRIARRHPDRPDEPAAADPAADGAEAADGEATTPAADTPTGAPPPADAPTERIEPVAPPPVRSLTSPGEQPTTLQPAVPPAADQGTTQQPAVAVPAAATGAAPAADAPPSDAAPSDQPEAAPPEAAAPRRAGFRARGRMRRRLRYLRRLREIQVRDLGGLAFDLRRFERKRDDLVAQKIDHIRACDDELRALETALGERRELRDVREPGIGGTCPRCFAVHGSADRFCSHCGVALGGAVQGPAQVAPAPPQASQPGP